MPRDNQPVSWFAPANRQLEYACDFALMGEDILARERILAMSTEPVLPA
jgi:hypothetical protein